MEAVLRHARTHKHTHTQKHTQSFKEPKLDCDSDLVAQDHVDAEVKSLFREPHMCFMTWAVGPKSAQEKQMTSMCAVRDENTQTTHGLPV